jgi:hypothetical protein
MSGNTDLVAVENQIQTVWSPVAMKELREKFILPSLVSKEYQGEIRRQNDTVRVSQVLAPSSKLREVGVDADTYEANKLKFSYCDLKADRRAVSAIEFDDLVEIQSIIDPAKNPEVRNAMLHDVGKQINDYLYSLLIPSTSSPDHTINSTATLTAALMASMREAAATAYWPKEEIWYNLMGTGYYSDFLSDNNLNDGDYGFSDAARSLGEATQKRYGFVNIEDNSKSLATSLHAFVPSALLYAAQTELRWKISDLHSSGKFGYALSCDLVFGAKLSIDGAKKCYTITSAA